jgi:hypothetical protein
MRVSESLRYELLALGQFYLDVSCNDLTEGWGTASYDNVEETWDKLLPS